jgi:hypothetical protein
MEKPFPALSPILGPVGGKYRLKEASLLPGLQTEENCTTGAAEG